MPPNQEHRSVFDILCVCVNDLVGGEGQASQCQMPSWMYRGCLRGMWPLRSWIILHFWNWNRAIWWILLAANLEQAMSKKQTKQNKKQKQFYGPDWGKFCILGESQIWLKTTKNQTFFFVLVKDKSEYFPLSTTLGGGWLHRPCPSQIFKIYTYAPELTHKSSIWKYKFLFLYGFKWVIPP